jgi:peptidoglycan/LPS O-acetylase OafA/YrhL
MGIWYQASRRTPTRRKSVNHQISSAAKLDALTSLRFFAAAMILVLHVADTFGFWKNTFLDKIALAQGVTFFFVLSGFILTYVHPQLSGPGDTKKFLIARFSRIWPTHIVTLLLFFALCISCDIETVGGWLVFAVNVLALQSWTLNERYFLTLNAPSWSISTEFFFYLCFPFLIKSIDRTWLPKLALGLGLSFGSVLLATWFRSANYGLVLGWTPDLIVVNPVCRLLEFITGMTLALAYRHFSRDKQSLLSATILELAAVAGVVLALTVPLAIQVPDHMEVLKRWFIYCGIAPMYGLLILTVALSRGFLSRILSWKILVHLGEISFSLYMFHSIILYWFYTHAIYLSDWSTWQKCLCAVVLSLLAARINFVVVETPCRRWLVGAQNGINIGQLFCGVRRAFSLDFIRALPLIEISMAFILCLVLTLHVRDEQVFSTRVKSTASINHGNSHESANLFGNQFWLSVNEISKGTNNVHLELTWTSTREQKMSYTSTIELLDEGSTVLMEKTYPQDIYMRKIKAGGTWQETINLRPGHLDKVTAVGISIREDSNPALFVQNGTRDRDNRRLIKSVQ